MKTVSARILVWCLKFSECLLKKNFVKNFFYFEFLNGSLGRIRASKILDTDPTLFLFGSATLRKGIFLPIFVSLLTHCSDQRLYMDSSS